MPVLEIRTYRLKPGTRDEFVRVMREESAPLLAAAGIRVLDAGPSLVDEDGFEEAYLVRVFDSLEHRAAQEDAFYGSAVWREGPREAIVSRIETYHTIVVEVPAAVIAHWRPATP
ncbi:NIPSNAP family protein [Hamadaea sp. NPDC050747]|uniref:NIPSNAP family protein n=1 Tax=Hamadaea sp. NPDC050747 TaxID=3155789 RepID=UPI0033E5BC63